MEETYKFNTKMLISQEMRPRKLLLAFVWQTIEHKEEGGMRVKNYVIYCLS